MLAVEKLLAVYNVLRPFVDIGILAFILYKAYQIVISTNSIQILRGTVIIALAYAAAAVFRLETLLRLLQALAPGLVVVFAIVFQPEIRKIFLKLGQKEWFSFGSRSKHSYVDSVLMAAEMLSKQRRGMLAVFMRHTKLDDIAKTGTRLNADLSSSLLVTIFKFDTPLHDGAVIIRQNRVLAATCYLPLSDNSNISKELGTRHRAALGLSEVSDAKIFIVSEETGAMSMAVGGQIYRDITPEQIKKELLGEGVDDRTRSGSSGVGNLKELLGRRFWSGKE